MHDVLNANALGAPVPFQCSSAPPGRSGGTEERSGGTGCIAPDVRESARTCQPFLAVTFARFEYAS